MGIIKGLNGEGSKALLMDGRREFVQDKEEEMNYRQHIAPFVWILAILGVAFLWTGHQWSSVANKKGSEEMVEVKTHGPLLLEWWILIKGWWVFSSESSRPQALATSGEECVSYLTLICTISGYLHDEEWSLCHPAYPPGAHCPHDCAGLCLGPSLQLTLHVPLPPPFPDILHFHSSDNLHNYTVLKYEER